MRLRLHNIGPIRDAEIEFAPLTVLVGPNGSGKTTFTSVAYACWLAHQQALELTLELLAGPALGPRSGTNEVPRPRAVVRAWQGHFVRRLDFELRRCASPSLVDLGRARRGGKGAGPRIEVSTEDWCLPFRLDGEDIWLETESPNYVRPRLQWAEQPSRRAVVERIRDVLGGDLPSRSFYFPPGRSGFVQTHTAISALVLSALSGGYFQDATLGAIPGPTADFMRFVAQVTTKTRSKDGHEWADLIERDLLHGQLRLDETEGARRFLFKPQGHAAEWPLQNMSTAVAEFAPLVLYLRYVAALGDSILIDEPESHLHPRNQVELARALANVSRVCNPVVVATHSELLVTALSTLLLESRVDKLPAPELAVYAFNFHDPERWSGVNVSELAVDPAEGFEVIDFAEAANDAYEHSVHTYNRLHGVESRAAT